MEKKLLLLKEWLEASNYFESNSDLQTIKLMEEVGELASARIKGNSEEIKDAVGDITVVLLSLCHFYGFTYEEALDKAYNDIKDRTYGRNPDGSWYRTDSLKK